MNDIVPNVVPLVEKYYAVSLFELFMQADIVVKAVMILLLIVSVYSWGVILDKNIKFFKVKVAIRAFEEEFWSEQSLDMLFKNLISKRDSNPFAGILVAAMQELNATKSINNFPIKNKESLFIRINNAMQVACNKAIAEIESHIGFLATVASSSPFVGLFGTVWGIMHSFQSIAASKNSTIAVVAPGIAEALLATTCGFIVAIPAAIFYNKFSQEIGSLSGRAENFMVELSNIISRDLDKN